MIKIILTRILQVTIFFILIISVLISTSIGDSIVQSLYKIGYFISMVWIPILVTLSLLSFLVNNTKEFFYNYFKATLSLMLWSILTILLFVFKYHRWDCGIVPCLDIEIFLTISALAIWGTTIAIKLYINSTRTHSIDTLFQYLIVSKTKIFYLLFKVFLSFFLLLQIILVISTFSAYSKAQYLTCEEATQRSFLYFYRPLITEINPCSCKDTFECKRWSYSKNKYVRRGD